MSQGSRREGVDEGIAIIGTGLRLPQSESLDAFWSHLAAGRSLITEVSKRRWDSETVRGDPARGEFSNSVRGGFVEDADCFDPAFFNISPREAAWMDPQQRFALELAWKAIEDAGYPAGALAGTRTGVYVGVCHWDYAELLEKHLSHLDAYTPTGIAFSIIANRVSHFFDLRGPSIANDTACAASITSVYEAVRALQTGECDLALAGGVNLTWSPNHFIAFSKNGMLSRDGASRAFDQRADGYVRGEGGAMLLLKPLARALADGDPIHAVIRAVGVNHGGRTNSLTVTNPQAQGDLIAEVMRRAGVAPGGIDYIEAHGTGTPLGDPIEIAGLKQAFARLHEEAGTTPVAGSCVVGSVKTNIGHLEGAAGVAGIVKVLAALRHGELPANVDFGQLNSLIDLDGSPFRIAGQSQPWSRTSGRPRRAGVSSFGFGGSNGHVLLEESPVRAAVQPFHGMLLLPLSARDPQRLRAGGSSLLLFVQQWPHELLADLAWTLQTGREAMQERVVFLVSNHAAFAQALRSFIAGEPDVRVRLPEGVAGATAPGLLELTADRWLAGGAVDWVALYEGLTPRRIHAPGYVFARERHWMDLSQGVRDPAPILHPLLQRNVSRLGGQRYQSDFSGSELFWAGHTVGAEQVLPGVTCLEMARAAWEHATGGSRQASLSLCFDGLVWARAIRATEARTTVEIRLLQRDDDQLAFEIAGGGPARVANVQGTMRPATASVAGPVTRDIEQLRSGATAVIEAATIYQRLRDSGMHHGASFQAVTRVWRGDGYLLASLKLPRRLRSTLESFPLHPVLLDAAIQAWMGFEAGGAPRGAAVPFACRRVEVTGPCEESMWAVLTPVSSALADTALKRFDIALCDQQGLVRVHLKELALLVMGEAGTGRDMVHSVPLWKPQPIAARDLPGGVETRIFLAGLSPALSDELAVLCGVPVQTLPALPEMVDSAAVAPQWFKALRQDISATLQGGFTLRQQWLVLVPASLPSSLTAPLASLLRTAGAEQPRVGGAVLQVDGLFTARRLAAIVAAENTRTDSFTQIRYDAGDRRLALRQAVVEAPPAASFSMAHADGVVWITGGLGGLGPHLASWLAARGVRRIVLSGRSAKPPAGRLERLLQQGVDVRYRACDVADPMQVRATVQWIGDRVGPLKGVVHAAGVLRDGYLFNKDAADVDAVFAPKVAGLICIDEATQAVDLEFMLLCSSIAGVVGNPAQSDYGAANAFMDAFAAERAARVLCGERHGKTISVAWPLWADGGMQVDAATLSAMKHRFGTVPLSTEVGLATLERILAAAGQQQVMLQYGMAERIHALLADPPAAPAAPISLPAAMQASIAHSPVIAAAAAPAPHEDLLLAATVVWLKDLLAELIQMDASRIRSNRKLEEYGLDSITIVEMTNRMEEVLGPLSKTLFFEYVNLDGLAGHLVEAHPVALAVLLASADAAPILAPVSPAAKVQADPFVAAPAAASTPFVGHDIAIVGMSLRVSGAADQESFWHMLEQGLHGFERYPASRWDHEALLHPQRDVLGKTVVQTGTFLEGIDEFDPRYFRISKAEAELMSPEVRLFLQSCVDAFEDAGYSRETMQRRYGGDVAVIVGSMTNEYDLYGFQNMLLRGSLASGSYTGTVPNMVSYYYGFTGPSYFLDTMCSAAATCVHEAVQMLRTGRCQMALAGGVSLLLHPQKLIATSQEHFTTKTAEVIRGYGMGADGTILGEGVGAFVMKRLEDAQRDGDHIYGLIKGTGISNAGTRNGFTVPSPQQQAAAIEKAWQDSGVDPRTIGYIEGHGSGTSLGDPIEIKALTQAFAKYTDARQFCPIGTVKSNVAHLLGAAALPGIAKVLMQMKHGMLAPSLHAQELNPNIAFEQTPFHVQRELAPWRRLHDDTGRELPLRAGVTSIGAGGMNAHIVLEEYRAAVPDATRVATPGSELCVFSAMTPVALRAVLARFCAWLERRPAVAFADIAWTLQEGRNELPCRLALVADDPVALLEELHQFLAAPQLAASGDRLFYSASILEHDLRVDPGGLEEALTGAKLFVLGDWWSKGVTIAWSGLHQRGERRRLSLPSYPFERIRCWYQSYPDAPSVVKPIGAKARLHPFIGSNRSDLHGVRYQTVIYRSELLDYGYSHERRPLLLPLVLPEIMAALAGVAGVAGGFSIERLEVALAVDWTDGDELAASVVGSDGSDLQLRLVMAAAGSESRPFAQARVNADAGLGGATQAFDLSALRHDARSILGREQVYQQLAACKLVFTPYLEVIAQAWLQPNGGMLCAVDGNPAQQDRFKPNLVLPPHLLGAAWQAIVMSRPNVIGLTLAAMESLRFGSGIATHVLVIPQPEQIDDVFFLDDAGAAVASLRGLRWLAAQELPAFSATAQPASAMAVRAPEVAVASSDVPANDGGHERLTTGLRQLVADLLKFPLHDVSPRALFYDLGFDSISLTRLAGEINACYDSAITPAIFFQCEHVEAVAAWLATRIDGSKMGAHLRPASPLSTPISAPVHMPEAHGGTLDIAIVGLAARLPGSADADEFFRHLLDGRDLVGPLPLERYGAEYRARIGAAGFPLWGGFLQDVDRFDASFFKTSPHEASRMDPQQRLMLETAWHAIENAGYSPDQLAADTGVFVGVSGQDYARVLQAHGVETDGYVATGNSLAMVANRLSWQLNLGGPSEAIDTACSSSLVALLRAADAIRSGRCSTALVGGANLALAVEGFEGPLRAGMLSLQGRCMTFSGVADGYVRGEGVVALLLKSRADAERDGDRILGLLIGGAQNHGGRVGSLTSPSANAQAALVRRAMQGIPAASIGYIETHGTGTSLGDPVEINGLRLAYASLLEAQRDPTSGMARIGLGALKSNIGHLEAAAGLAGVAKVLLAMQAGELPPNLHCDEVNSYVDLDGSPFFLLRERQPWLARLDAEGRELPRRAAVSSFGFGGSNAHVVLQAHPDKSAASRRKPLEPRRFADTRYWIPGVATGAANETVLLRSQWQAGARSVWPSGAQASRRRLILPCDAAAFGLSADTPGLIAVPALRGDVGERYRALAEMLLRSLQEEILSGNRDEVLVQLLVPLGDDRELYEGLGAMLDTAAAECPRLLGQVIGLPAAFSADDVMGLLNAEAWQPTERRVRYVDGQRLVRRWTELAASSLSPPPWRADGTYLITGGMGALGLLVAREIARQAPGVRLFLVGSAPLDARRMTALAGFEQLGATAVYRQADVSDRAAVARVVQEALQLHDSLQGVIHCAGVHRDSAIIRKSPEQLQAVFAPKVGGAMALLQACRGLALERFVLFSSMAGATGNPGQADYAAANGFLDALASREGGVMISLDWSLWHGGGMRPVPGGELALYDAMGQRPLASDQGLAALNAALTAAAPQVAVVGGDGARIRAFFRDTGRNAIPAIGPLQREGDGQVHGPLLDRVGQSLRTLLAQLSGLQPQAILLDEALDNYGIDSLMIGKLNDALKAQFGILSSALFFEYRTLRGVARFLARQHAAASLRWTGGDTAGAGASPVHDTQADAAASTEAAAGLAFKSREPIAVIGISGQYPEAPDLDAFWHNLAAGRDAVTDIPAGRWPMDAFWMADPDQAVARGCSYARRGGFLEGFADFDPLFFRISPREAVAMDPQERLFLMQAWAACEDAGYTRKRFAAQHGSRVGVFAGVTKTGYALHGPLHTENGGMVRPTTSFASVANRVSHVMDLNGPSMPVDTMCSSSLTAIHEACEHLTAGACEVAIAGGVNLYLHPTNFIELSAARMLSPDGVCRSFGLGGNGFVPGEGVGCVVLKPLSRALADGDRIHALIRGSAVNHGGKTNGYTVPNPVAQRDVIRAALQRAGLQPQAVSCIEAHGTGTELGDPVEFDGLVQVFGTGTGGSGRCALGSVKSGIGHLEAAAGIAGMTKLILQLRHRQLVPTLHAAQPNPRLQFDGTPFVLQLALEPWQPVAADGTPKPRIAGVSSFGAGGANAHVIVEEWPTSSFPLPQLQPVHRDSDGRACPILLSARNGVALQEAAQRLLGTLEGRSRDVSAASVVAGGKPDLAQAVRTLLAGILGVDDLDLDLDEAFDSIGLEEFQRQALRHACEREFNLLLENGAFRWLDSVGAVAADLAQRLPAAAPVPDTTNALSPDVRDLAWTLQVGREAMDCRLAIIARTPRELASSLRAWLTGEGDAGQVFAATASENKGMLSLLTGEKELAPMLERWLTAGDLPRVLGLWVRGFEVDWSHLGSAGSSRRPRILSLPTYPFARERFWMSPDIGTASLISTIVSPSPRTVPLREAHEELERQLGRLVRAELGALGAPASVSFWMRWRTALDALLPGGTDIGAFDRAAAWAGWDAYKHAASATGGPMTQIALAETCVRALPELLAGRLLPTAVMFPAGQLAQVEAVYRHNAVAEHFNDRLANAAAAFLAQRLAADAGTKLRILEIGAGTGGTTRRVLDALESNAAAIAEYRYTDVSRAFLIHGQRHFSSRASFLRTALFDVERPVTGQDVEAGAYDLIIAANVLHATCDIRSTMEIVHGLLVPGGVVLLNEISCATVFTHLTFGLLDGWWRFTDPERRLSGSPALTSASWRKVMEETGFEWLAGTPDGDNMLGQQVLAAVASRGRAAALPVATTVPAQVASERLSLRSHLLAALATTLNVAPEVIDVNRPFADYGLDSILGAELVHALGTRLGIVLEQIQLFDSTTVCQLEAFLKREHSKAVARVERTTPAPVSSPAAVGAVSVEPEPDLAREPIAIVGISGRFAGSDDIEQLWQHLLAGRDLVGPVNRFDLKPFVGEVAPGAWCDHGSFIDGIDQFDAQFFNISGLEATYMDPQQRMFLEQAWLTLEHAGHAGSAIEGRRCGVFVGCAHGDYQELFRSQPPGQAFWGNTCSLIPARIAYYLNLKGPALAVDTACSSSLVAVHLACQSLWSGESELALAGGVFVQSSPRFYRYANQARMLSPGGRCAAFGAGADGIVPGEAVAALLLRPLSQAIADGDTVHGLIVASGMNQDGATNGITAPSALSQEQLIRDVYKKHGIDPGRFGMVEAHGTGTVLGDPIEHAALSRAFRSWTDEKGYCALGSIKSNLGHSTTAAGVTGLVRVLLALQHQTIPPTIHAQLPNPALSIEDSPFFLNSNAVPWPATPGLPRQAAVSSFGFGGTNAHMVLQEAPLQPFSPPAIGAAWLVPLSARSADQLRKQAQLLLVYIERAHGQQCADIAFTLCTGRRHLAHRMALVAGDVDELRTGLVQWLKGSDASAASNHVDSDALAARGEALLARLTNSGPAAESDRTGLNEVGMLYVAGAELALERLFDSATRRRVPLPSNPFSRKRFWIAEESAAVPDAAAGPVVPAAIAPFRKLRLADPAMALAATSPLTRPQVRTTLTSLLPVSALPNAQHAVLRLADIDGVRRLQVHGPVDAALLQALAEELQTASADESIRAVLLDGCAGWTGSALMASVSAPLDCALPVVAAPASAGGAGFMLALYCDFLVLADEGRYACTLPLTDLQSALLLRRFGDDRAAQLLSDARGLTGAKLDTGGHVTTAAQIADRALALAREIAAAPRISLVALKRHMRSGPQMPAGLPAADLAAIPLSAGDRPDLMAATVGRPLPMASSVVTLELFDDGVVLLRMAEREHRNTFTPAFMEGMQEAFALIARTDVCKVVVLTGYDHYFACGGTRDGLESLQRGATRFTDRTIYSLPLDCDLPVIAAMQGHAIGAGWSLGLFCDSALYSADSVYHSNYMWYGFTPGAGATMVFPHRMGDDLGREVLFTAREYKGRELAARASCLAVFPAAQVLPHALMLAHRMARESRRGLQAAKQAASASFKTLIRQVFEHELAMHQTTFVGNARVMERIASVFPAAVDTARPQTAPAPLTIHRSRVREWMARTLAEELMIDVQDVSDSAGFLQLGLDSILAVTWIRMLNAHLSVELPATSVYAYPTFGALLDQVSRLTSSAELVVAAPDLEVVVLPMVNNAAQLQASSVPLTPARMEPEPVAIIGASGRFPLASDLAAFWDNLSQGRDCIVEVPATRWNISTDFDPDPQAPGKSYSKWMGAIDDIDRFDAGFFNITGREAELMDPQQRLFLQHAWHAIEDAAIAPISLAGTRCGVFAGSGDSGYAGLISERNAYSLIGRAGSILASRIAYLLDLRGPCIALDTACSTSLVAIAQACDSLAIGNSDLALAGGACVMIGSEMHVDTSKVSMLSPDGRCYSFDHRANGFVPGEGVGVLLLKRLVDAERDGDPIRAVIRGWGTNQDGRTNGITAPNPFAQADLIRGVHRRFSIDPASIGLIEAHGTGTPLGDPIEVEGLNAAFGDVEQSAAGRNIALGSVKSNVGHLLAAAGVAGAIKAMLSLEHAALPPTINFERENEHLELANSPLRVNTALMPWPAPNGAPRRAGVSAFGFSGTNAHLVLEEYRQSPAPAGSVTGRSPLALLCVLSARGKSQLVAQAQALARHLDAHPDVDLGGVGHTLQTGRSAFEFRAAALFQGRDDLLSKLQAIATGSQVDGVWHGVRDPGAVALFEGDADGRGLVQKWLAAGQLDKLAVQWTKGVSVDWGALPGSSLQRRLRLPGYAFAADRHWVRPATQPAPVTAPAQVARLHPLIDRNASTLERARFAGRFSGDEVYLSHYVSGAERLLLGLFYPEMARAAGEMAAGRSVRALRRMVWGKPAKINGEPRELVVVLDPCEEGLLYRICPDGDASRPCHIGELVLDQNEVGWPALPLLELPPVGRDLTDSFRVAAPRANAVRKVLQSGNDLFAYIRLGSVALDAMVIDPLVLDVLWELVCFNELSNGLTGPRFPYALASLLQDGSLPDEGWVRLWRRDSELSGISLLLTDSAGRARLLLDGLLTEQIEALPALHLGSKTFT